jgi:pimeloyl-ACP methyl ester carboxylesterase
MLVTQGNRRNVRGRYAPVNGLKLYYEIQGTGQPLVLLHGGLGGTSMFAELMPALAESRQVIAVDLQGHGHTADIDRPIRLEWLADDVAALLRHLEVDSADIFGYSMGGGVALQTAIRHPGVVRRLVIVSAPCTSEGWYPEMSANAALLNAGSAAALEGTEMYEAYAVAAPRPEDWPVLVRKMGELMRRTYDWSPEVARIEVPTLIVVGDADFVRLDHAVEMYRLLGGGQANGQGGMPASQLAILPGTDHYTTFARADLLLPILTEFLKQNNGSPV